MSAYDMLYGKSPFGRVIPATMTDGEVSGLSTKIDFIRPVDIKPSFASPSASAGDKYFTGEGANGNKYSVPDRSKNRNVLTGEVISDDTGDKANDKMDFEVFCTPAQRLTIINAYRDGTVVFGIRSLGWHNAQADAGYEYIMGKITDLTDTPDNSVSKLTFSITASSSVIIAGGETPAVAYTDFNTAATGSGNTITPENESAKTITAITSDDWDDLIVGKIVIKNS